MLQTMSKFRSSFGSSDDIGEKEALESLVERTTSVDIGADAIQRVIREVISSRDLTNERVDPFLMQMKRSLETFVNNFGS